VKAAANPVLATCVCPECMNIKDKRNVENTFPDPAVGLEKMKMAGLKHSFVSKMKGHLLRSEVDL
jgi:hypothetical protein